MRQTSNVIAIGLVGGERPERLIGLPAFDAYDRKTKLAQPMKQDRRHASGFEYDPTTARRFRELRLALVDDHAFAVENANMRFVVCRACSSSLEVKVLYPT